MKIETPFDKLRADKVGLPPRRNQKAFIYVVIFGNVGFFPIR